MSELYSLCGATGGEFAGSYYMPCFISWLLGFILWFLVFIIWFLGFILYFMHNGSIVMQFGTLHLA